MAATSEAIDCEAETETAMFATYYAAPNARITYMEDGWSNGTVTLASYQRTIPITRHYYHSIPRAAKEQPEYIAYLEELQAWHNAPATVQAREANKRASDATRGAIGAQNATWHALVAFPLHDAPSIADKLETAFPWVDEDPDLSKALFDAMAADLARAVA